MNILAPILKSIGRKALIVPAVLGLMSSAAIAEIQLVFGAYAADKPTAVVKQFQPFLSLLATELTKEMGETVKIKMKIARSYDDGIDDLVQGRVDFSRFGPASYITAKEGNGGIGIIAMETTDGNKVFSGVIAVRSDSTISSIADLNGRSFAFGDHLSTIGRFLAQDLLLDAQITAAELSNFEYLGRHDAVGAAVGVGTYDAGALKMSTFEKLVKKEVPIKILQEFDNVTKPWIHRAGMDATVVAAMQKVFLQMPASDVRDAITDTGFVVGTDEDYQPIRRAMTRSEQFGG